MITASPEPNVTVALVLVIIEGLLFFIVRLSLVLVFVALVNEDHD